MKKGRKESNKFLTFCVFVDLNSNFKGSYGYCLFAMEVFAMYLLIWIGIFQIGLLFEDYHMFMSSVMINYLIEY